jgi:uncharacterized membrane protein YkoI
MARSTVEADNPSTMTTRLLWLLAAMLLPGVTPARAQSNCFTAEDTREHVQRHGLIPLNDVVRSARGGAQADLISARLCETAGNLVYMIAMLGRDGKVMRLTVDARSGDVINHR